MPIALAAIPGALDVRGELPRVEWRAVAEWVESNVGLDARPAAWLSLGRQWLESLVDGLPSEYSLFETPESFLVAALDQRDAARLARRCQQSRRAVLELLTGVGRWEHPGKPVTLAFGDWERYYDYVSHFYPDEGEFGTSGGMYLGEGYPHVVLFARAGEVPERTIAHELTHAALGHLSLPLWLNEGLAQWIADRVVGSSSLFLDQLVARRHREYWTPDTIQGFWTGVAFHALGTPQTLSYQLAHLLVYHLVADHPRRMIPLLTNARPHDAGEAALQASCHTQLEELVAQFLGSGAWGPTAPTLREGHSEGRLSSLPHRTTRLQSLPVDLLGSGDRSCRH